MIGITSNAVMYQYPQADLSETLRLLAKDFRLIEIDGNRFVLNDKQLLELARAKKAFGLEYRVHAPVFGVNLAGQEIEVRQRSVQIVKHYIEAARKLNAKSVNVHAGNMLMDIDPYLQEKVGGRKLFLNYAKQSIDELGDYATTQGIHLTVENMFGPFSLGLTTDEIRALTSSKVGFCFDCGHAFLSQSLDTFVKEIPNPDYMHLCDSDARIDHLAVGEGDIDFKSLLKKLKLKKNDIVMEIISTHDKIRKSKEAIESLIR